MTAEQSRNLSNLSLKEHSESLISKIYRGIETECKLGFFRFSFNIPTGTTSEVERIVIDKLKASGYDVTHSKGYDQRDGESWNALIISWDKPKSIVLQIN